MTEVLFSHTDVQKIVDEEVLCKAIGDPEWVDPAIESTGVNPLKERVTERVRGAMQINSGDLPEKVIAWVHRMCLVHTGGVPDGVPVEKFTQFTGKLAIPVKLTTLSNSDYHRSGK